MDIETFAHLVAHDLKAPLNGIASMVDVVVEDYGARLDDQGRDHLRLIRSMATRSVAMVDALRQYSWVSTADLHLRTIDLGETAPRLLAEAAGRVSGDAVVQVDLHRGGPVVLADPVLIPLLLSALFTNAVTFSRRPVRRVTFAALPEPGRPIPGGQACFAVSDDGIGIPTRYQEAVFDMFRRLHGPDMFGGGVGAGLALAHAITARHGGALWIERSGDDGTTVAFSLPHATPAGGPP